MIVQHTKWLQEANHLAWRAPVASLNILLTSTCWRNDHNGFSHQGPGLIDVMLSKRGRGRAHLSSARREHAAVGRRPLPPLAQLRQPHRHRQAAAAAVAPDRRGLRTRGARRVRSGSGRATDGATSRTSSSRARVTRPRLETIAAAWWLRGTLPELRVRVVNVVDLMALFAPSIHPHGMSDASRFVELFTRDKPVVFAFHGYQFAVHQLVHRPSGSGALSRARLQRAGNDDDAVRHGRAEPDEPLPSRRHSPIQFGMPAGERATALLAELDRRIDDAVRYTREHFEDPADIRDWKWSEG